MARPRLNAVVALIAILALSTARAGQPIRVCDDSAGWPPYTFADPKDPSRITGASAEVISEVLRRAGYEPQIALLPWRRCLSEVEDGSSAMLINATHNEERAQKYLLSEPYYSVTSALYYRSDRFPSVPRIASVADMKAYRYCGLFGYNYSMYSIPDAQLDTGARGEASRFEKLRLGRCDFVIGDVEILRAFAAMGQLDLSGTASIPIPGAGPKNFHAMISRTASGGEKLLKDINDGLAALKADKTYAKVFKRFGL